MIWLAVLVTLGIRSNVAALFAGLSFTLLPGVGWSTCPAWGNVPPLLFGLGAIAAPRTPMALWPCRPGKSNGCGPSPFGKRHVPGASLGAGTGRCETEPEQTTGAVAATVGRWSDRQQRNGTIVTVMTTVRR